MQRSAVLGILFVIATATTVSAAGVQVAITPATIQVAPGAEFDLRIEVTQAGTPFNAYHAIVGFDGAVLTFVQLPASSQEGSYMTGACGNTFQQFTASAYELEISHSILCTGLDLPGPGELYVLHFVAPQSPQETTVFFAEVEFADSGSPVPVLQSTPAVVQVVNSTDVGAQSSPGVWFSLAPNPVHAAGELHILSFGPSTEQLLVTDVRGRIVDRRTWQPTPGSATRVWRVADRSGRPLPAGVYFVTVGDRTRHTTRRITVIR